MVELFLEILDPVTVKFIKDPNTKKIVLGFASLGIGLALAAGNGLFQRKSNTACACSASLIRRRAERHGAELRKSGATTRISLLNS